MSNDVDYWKEGRNADKIGFEPNQAIYLEKVAV